MASGPQTTRVAKTAPVTLTHTFVIGETPTDPAANAVTVTITDANGGAISSGPATRTSAGVYTYSLAGQANLGRYTVVWSGTFSGSAVAEVDYLDIAGSRYFTLVDGRASDPSLADQTKYPTTLLDTKRMEVEDELDQICDRAFVPRYRRAVLDGSGGSEILLTDAAFANDGRSMADVRTIRSAKIAPRFGGTFTALTAGQLAACYPTADGKLQRVDGGVWTEGVGNVIIELEYGWDAPPSDLVDAMYVRLRDRLNSTKSGIPDRASSFTVDDGGTYRLDMPASFKTGIPAVDAVYGRYSRRSGAGTGNTGRLVAASRTLTYDPQRASMFHGKAF